MSRQDSTGVHSAAAVARRESGEYLRPLVPEGMPPGPLSLEQLHVAKIWPGIEPWFELEEIR